MGKTKNKIAVLALLFCLFFTGCDTGDRWPIETPELVTTEVGLETESQASQIPGNIETEITEEEAEIPAEPLSLSEIPEYAGSPYVEIHNNTPDFDEKDLTTEPFETYSGLDTLGRCGVAFANVCQELMPTEERGEIGQVRPSGWQLAKYDNVDGKYLYNRCHLIAYQLAGENANVENLITGTRYLNIQGMLPFENQVADYVKETNNHVLYRVTPLFEGDNLVASGVEMEALSVEDEGKGVSFHVFCYNVQPGIRIDYATGDSWQVKGDISSPRESNDGEKEERTDEDKTIEDTYVLNTNTQKFHSPSCSSVKRMSEHNKKKYTGSREKLVEEGYEPCQICNP